MSAMRESFRIFRLLAYKNCLVRLKNWRIVVFVQLLIPLLLVLMGLTTRMYSVESSVFVEDDTYYPPQNKSELVMHLIKDMTYVYYLPQDGFTISIMNQTRRCLRLPRENVIAFNSELEMLDAYKEKMHEDPLSVVIAVDFRLYDSTNLENFKYIIRSSGRGMFKISSRDRYDSRDTNMQTPWNLPHILLQMCLDEAFIIRMSSNSNANDPKFLYSLQEMPDPPHVKVGQNEDEVRVSITVFVIIALGIIVCSEIGYTGKEKLIGVNVLMAMNGLPLHQNLLSWLVNGIMFSLIYVTPMAILFAVSFVSGVNPYISYGNVFLFWLCMMIHASHLIAYGMHVSAYFTKPLYATFATNIIYMASLIILVNMKQRGVTWITPPLGFLVPDVLLFQMFDEINSYEKKLIGIKFCNIFVSGNEIHGFMFSIGGCLILSILGLIFHFLMSIYISNLFPGKYGIAKHPLYFAKAIKKNKVCHNEEISDFDYDTIDGTDFETVSKGILTAGIQIRNLKKTYVTGLLHKTNIHALKGISVDFYKGQITALLGHNGAGKSTTMHILTGLTSATEGSVFVNGKSVKHDLEEIRKDFGLCPQENLVFPDLTVYQQILFFGLLKGRDKTKDQVTRDTIELIEKLNLSKKKHALPRQLSGGQKRRLCLGMALIGDASTLVLDEPTSGMDPETRRDIWDLILKMRGHKTILLTTHNMEEADILGDRIAIIHSGRMQCYGTPMFLKKKYGRDRVEVTLSTSTWCDPQNVLQYFDDKTETITADSDKLILSVPYTDTLPDSLDRVEGEKSDLGITGMSVSLITIEQVFLKVINEEEPGTNMPENYHVNKISGKALCWERIKALFDKKFVFAKKNAYTILFAILLPVLAILLMVLSYSSEGDDTDVYAVKLDMYRYPQSMYTTDEEIFGEMYRKTVESFNGKSEIAEDSNLTAALLHFGRKNYATYRNNFITSAKFMVINDGGIKTLLANGFYLNKATFAIPLTINLLSNALIKSYAGESYSIELFNQNLPDVDGHNELIWVRAIGNTAILSIVMSLTISIFVIHPLQENVTSVKQLQRMTGVSCLSYWGTIFLFDFLTMWISTLITVAGLYIMDVSMDIRFYRSTEIGIMILMLMLYSISVLPIVYLFSFLRKQASTIMTILTMVPLGIVVLQYILDMLLNSHDNLLLLYSFQQELFKLVPYVSFFQGLITFMVTGELNGYCRRLPECLTGCSEGICQKPKSYFETPSKGEPATVSLKDALLYLGLTPLIYFAILAVLEMKLIPKLISKLFGDKLRDRCLHMDELVRLEKENVAREINKRMETDQPNLKVRKSPEDHIGNGHDNDALRKSEDDDRSLFLVHELSKYYGKLMAVKEVSFSVKNRECFGLLGVNGAGKSTTFRMLTGDEIPNSGIMFLGDSNIKTDRNEYFSQMGYCPQTDAILSSLNSYDHLRLFARLRGIPKDKIDLEVNRWINRLNLKACAHQPSGTYSGGNKRRLNTAMALIGNPTLVLLDEPTSGVDPAARRALWHVLKNCQKAGQAIILTSHSMEECEVLCNRLVIMVKGELVCIGPSQQLKQRFGAGCDIQIKLNPGRLDEDVRKIKNIIESVLTCTLTDENMGFLSYHITDPKTTWRSMYGAMNNIKQEYPCVEDFSVLSATLEQLFIQFARGSDNMRCIGKESASQPV